MKVLSFILLFIYSCSSNIKLNSKLSSYYDNKFGQNIVLIFRKDVKLIDQKYLSLKEGNLLTSVEKRENYCEIESIRVDSVFRKGEQFKSTLKKLKFKNKDLHRYTFFDSNNFAIYCEFGKQRILESSELVNRANRHLKDYVEVKLLKYGSI